jgi:hypothetical protein
MWIGGSLIGRLADYHLYASARRAGRARQIWAKLRCQQNQLLDLTTMAATCAIGDRRAAGTRIVPIQQIRGSEGRCEDFDAAFHPLKAHTEDRWLSVAKANLRGRGLPPVELIQVGEVYFVRDGHHRISVAAALGQQEIDAVVTVWQVTVPAQAQRADVERPQPHQSRAFLLRLARGSTAEV